MKVLNLITEKRPKASIAEAYKILRTNIQFSSFDKEIKIILVTSACPKEGKSITSANLAVVMAQSGKKILLMDCDLRKPSIHEIFGISNTYGLSNLLVANNIYEPAIVDSGIKNLHLLTSGMRPPNPSELLSSKKMEQFINSLRDKYDYIIMDTPPILLVTDAQVISKYSDGCLLVIASGKAEKGEVIKGKAALEKVDSRILGVVLNRMKVKSKSYSSQYYYGYQYKKRRNKRKEILHLQEDIKL